MNKKINIWYFMIGGVVVVVFLLLLGAVLFGPTGQYISRFEPSVRWLAANAFGSLSLADAQAPQGAPAGLGAGTAVDSRAGGGGGVGVDELSRIVPPFPYTVYEFSYPEEITLENVPTQVFRRDKSPINTSSVARSLQNLTFGLIDGSTFNNFAISYFTLTEQVPQNALTMTVDFNEAAVSVSQDWRTWDYNQQGTEFTLANYPSDEQIISAAQQFVQQHNIDTSAFGEPVVDDSWRRYVTLAQQRGEPVYVPQDATVRYPLRFGEYPVYEQWGGEYGVYLNVNLQRMQVTSAYNLIYPSFDSSEYALQENTDAIRDVLRKGGSPYPVFYEEGQEGLTIESLAVGDPQIVYMHFYRWQENQSDDLFVPAFRFPVTGQPTDRNNIPQEYIIVPLVADLYENLPQPPVLPVEPDNGIGDTEQGEAGVSIRSDFGSKIVYEYENDLEAMQSDCAERGGEFSECGSSCAPDAEICTLECAYTCEITE